MAIKREYGSRAVYLGGGSDLLVHKPAQAEVAIDIRHADIGFVMQGDDAYVIGGGAILRDVECVCPRNLQSALDMADRKARAA